MQVFKQGFYPTSSLLHTVRLQSTYTTSNQLQKPLFTLLINLLLPSALSCHILYPRLPPNLTTQTIPHIQSPNTPHLLLSFINNDTHDPAQPYNPCNQPLYTPPSPHPPRRRRYLNTDYLQSPKISLPNHRSFPQTASRNRTSPRTKGCSRLPTLLTSRQQRLGLAGDNSLATNFNGSDGTKQGGTRRVTE